MSARAIGLGMVLALAACQSRPAPPRAIEGTLDLRGWDFDRDGSLPLDGEWRFYWQRLQPIGKPDGFLPPRKWTGVTLPDGRRLGPTGFATYRLTIRLPDTHTGGTLAIATEAVASAGRLRLRDAGGESLAPPLEAGVVGTSAESSRGLYRRDLSILSPGSTSELELELEVSNYQHARGGPLGPPILGSSAQVTAAKRLERELDFLLIGILLVIGLHHLGLFALRRLERAPLWLSMWCFLFALRALLVGRYLEEAYPDPRYFDLWLRIEYLTFYAAVPPFALFLRALFPRYAGKHVVRVIIAISIGFIATLLLPTLTFTALVFGFYLFVVAGMAWGFWVLGHAIRVERDVIPLLMLLGFVAFSAGAVHDILRGLQWVRTGQYVTHYGLAAFLLFQSLLLSLMNQRARRQLEQRNDEVISLNEELRRQIGDRSHKLSNALTLLAADHQRARELEPGTLLADHYRVVRKIGAGGMGTVYLATRLSDQRPVAIKIIRTASSARALARFAREAEVASTIDHPNVVAILDIDVTATGDLFLAMELVEGRSLEDERARFGELAWALPLLGQLARALEAIHHRHVIHRDLKPANVLIAEGVLKLADFGIASLARPRKLSSIGRLPTLSDADSDGDTLDSSSDPKLTNAGAIMGSPQYMAPELATGVDKATPEADLFSFGLIAYEMLTGRFPYRQSVVFDRIEGRTTEPPAPIAHSCPDLSPSLATAIDRCLKLDPASRPTATTVAASFE